MRNIYISIPLFIAVLFYGNSVSADCFVALKNGYVQTGPTDAGEIRRVFHKWDIIEDLFIHKVGEYYWFEGKEYDFRAQKTGWAYWKETRQDPPEYVGYYRPATGSVGNILLFDPTGRNSEVIETRGMVTKYVGRRNTKKLEWLKPFFIQKVRYYPIKTDRKYVKKNRGVVVYDDYPDVSRRVEHLKYRHHYPERLMMVILQGKVMKGMTREQVIASWGKPREVKESYGSWGEQHVLKYYKRRLNFENGKLTSIKTY